MLSLNTIIELPLTKLILNFYKNKQVLDVEDIKALQWDDQKTLLECTIYHPLLNQYPANNEYVKLFLKQLIDVLERESEVHDDLYTCLCYVMSSKQINTNFYFRHYIIDNDIDKIVSIKETNNVLVNGTTGMRTWEAAMVLADWALDNKHLFLGKKLLELGSGVGLTGITIGKYCDVESIYLTDCHEDVIDALNENIAINFPDHERKSSPDMNIYQHNNTIGVLKLDWDAFTGISNKLVPDILIGADIIYDPSILDPLCAVINKILIVNPKLNIYIASAIRNIETHNLFLKALDKIGCVHQIIVHEKPIHLDWNQDINKCLLQISKI